MSNMNPENAKRQCVLELTALLDKLVPESLKGRRNDFDALSKALLKDPANGRGFLKTLSDQYFPDYQPLFHFDQLTVLETEFGGSKGKQYRADLVLCVPMDLDGFEASAEANCNSVPKQANAIFHVEHLSNQKSARAELLSAAKSAEYVAVLRRNLLSWETKENNPLPDDKPLYFISALLRHGKRPFRGISLLQRRVALIKDNVFLNNSINGIPFVMDLSMIPDDIIKEPSNSPEFIAVLLVLKWVYSPENASHFSEAVDILKSRSEEISNFDLLEYLLVVIYKNGHFSLKQLDYIIQNYPVEGELKMSIEENVSRWIDYCYTEGMEKGMEKGMVKGMVKGREKGRKEGREEGVIISIMQLLRKRFSDDLTDIEYELYQKTDFVALQSLLALAIDCQSLEEFKADL